MVHYSKKVRNFIFHIILELLPFEPQHVKYCAVYRDPLLYLETGTHEIIETHSSEIRWHYSGYQSHEAHKAII